MNCLFHLYTRGIAIVISMIISSMLLFLYNLYNYNLSTLLAARLFLWHPEWTVFPPTTHTGPHPSAGCPFSALAGKIWSPYDQVFAVRARARSTMTVGHYAPHWLPPRSGDVTVCPRLTCFLDRHAAGGGEGGAVL